MLKGSSNTKLIVIIGYIVLISLSALGIVLIYMELLKFSKVNEPSDERKELVIIGNTLSSLYQAEGAAGLLAVEVSPNLKQKYDSLINLTIGHIDSLKVISNEPELTFRLDTVASLVFEKQKNTWEIIQLLNTIETHTTKNVSRSTVLTPANVEDLNELLLQQQNNSEKTVDTTVVQGPKKGLFRRISDAIKSDSQNSVTQITQNVVNNFDTLVVPAINDTIKERINEIFYITQKRNASIISRLTNRQNILYRANEKLTAEINQIMRGIEKREYNNTVKLLKEKTETIQRSSKIVSIVGISALAMTIIFLSLAIRSISVGQRLQKELERAKKVAENLLQSRERLFLTITHDIKAPISSIIGYIELLLKNKPGPKESGYIENMLHSSEHILDLIKNLLDFHALESKDQNHPGNQMVFSPYTLTSDIFESFIPIAQKKKLEFQFECKIDKNKYYSSDPYRIRQIVNNLISNAVKFTQANGLIIFTATITEQDNQSQLVLSVKDNGPGIKEENMALLFQEFQRFNNSVEGYGLGLPITERLTKALGGSITVDSSLGKGSDFTVTIPLFPTDEITNKKNISGGNSGIGIEIPAIATDKRILFIDDDIIQLNLYSELLKQKGFSPIISSASGEALNLLQKIRFDIVFSDIQMPDMNGFELVEHIRNSSFEGASSIPIVALSAVPIPEQRLLEAGFSGFLSKPFTSKQLFFVIEQFLANQLSLENSSYENNNKGFYSLIEFASDDKNAARAILQTFIDESKKNIELLKKAYQNDDWEEIKQISHKMLPTMKMISAKEIICILQEHQNNNRKKENETILLDLICEEIEKAEEFKKSFNG